MNKHVNKEKPAAAGENCQGSSFSLNSGVPLSLLEFIAGVGVQFLVAENLGLAA